MTGRRVQLDSWSHVIQERERAGNAQLPPHLRPVVLMRNGQPALARCPDCRTTKRLTLEQVGDVTLRFCPCGGVLEVMAP